MQQDTDWLADLSRYPSPRPFLKEQSIWAVWVYRLGRRIERRPQGLWKSIMTMVYWLLFRLVETLLATSVPRSASIGPGLRIWHFGGIFIHPNSVIGANCTLRQGVTIGNRHDGGPTPVIGNDVDFGAYAQLRAYVPCSFRTQRAGKGRRTTSTLCAVPVRS